MLRALARACLPTAITGALRGRRRGVGFLFSGNFGERWRMLERIQRVTEGVRCEHSETEAMLYAKLLMELPDTVKGDIMECGCYLGGSTAKLSIVARATKRKVVACDSFQGLPSENQQKAVTYSLIDSGAHDGSPVVFRQGDYAGSLEQVKDTVARLGEPSVVEYLPGFFADTLPHWKGQAAAVIVDVDLVESTRDCVRHLWPRLSRGGILFSQDCHLKEICDLMTDTAFWRELGETSPPRFVGMGSEKLVYTIKP